MAPVPARCDNAPAVMALLTELVTEFRRHDARLQKNWVQRLIDGRPDAESVREALSGAASGLYDSYLDALDTGDITALRERGRAVADQVGPRGMKPQEVLEIVLLLRDVLARELLRVHGGDSGALADALDAFEPAATRVATRLALGFFRDRLSGMPPLDERMFVVSAKGTVDLARARHIAERLLLGIRASRARGVVLDVTRVTSFAHDAASHVIDAVKAARLLGSTVVLAGWPPRALHGLERAARNNRATLVAVDGTSVDAAAVIQGYRFLPRLQTSK